MRNKPSQFVGKNVCFWCWSEKGVCELRTRALVLDHTLNVLAFNGTPNIFLQVRNYFSKIESTCFKFIDNWHINKLYGENKLMASNLLNLAGSLVSSFIFLRNMKFIIPRKKKKRHSNPKPHIVSICQALAGLTVSVRRGRVWWPKRTQDSPLLGWNFPLFFAF